MKELERLISKPCLSLNKASNCLFSNEDKERTFIFLVVYLLTALTFLGPNSPEYPPRFPFSIIKIISLSENNSNLTSLLLNFKPHCHVKLGAEKQSKRSDDYALVCKTGSCGSKTKT